ncbi:MAG: type II toxin-antitoxin system HicB family antitoxin [Bryobacteraceae bacterium]
MTYTVIYEKGPTSWGAYVPDLPGVISVGESRAEVEGLIQEAIEFHLEGLREEGRAIPLPSSFAGVVEIDPAA